MQDDAMFDRIHDALDIEAPAGAYERLRIALTKKPARSRRWPALSMRWSKMGFRVATGLAILAIAVAAGAAALAIHNAGSNNSPAGSRMSIQAYQKLVDDDNAIAGATYEGPCDVGVRSGCSGDAMRGIPAVQKWLNDLSRPDIPTRFAVVNAEMRQQLMANLTAQNDLLSASQKGDGHAMDRAFISAIYAVNWTGTVVPAIDASKQVSATVYTNTVAGQKASLDSCLTNCPLLASSQARTCATNGGVPCVQMFDEVAMHYAVFAGALVQYAAPDSLATKDLRLQTDLASANSVLITMRLAVAANDQAGINSAIDQLIRLTAQIDQDAVQITG